MGNVDRIIAIAGIGLLVAAAAGLVIAQESALLDDYTHPTHEVSLTTDGSVNQPAEFVWDDLNGTIDGTPYQANLTIEVRFSGQAFSGGSATILAELTTPNGTVFDTTKALSIPAGSSNAATTFEMGALWAGVPEDVRAIGDSLDALPTFDEPLMLRITVEEPAEALAPAANYNFDATVTGVSHVYTRAMV